MQLVGPSQAEHHFGHSSHEFVEILKYLSEEHSVTHAFP